MDTINTAVLHNHFGNNGHRLLYADERYSEEEMSFSEPALGAGNIRTIATAAMRLTEFCLQTGHPVKLADTQPSETTESAFILKGDIESRFNNAKDTMRFSRQQHNLQYNTDFSGEHTLHSGELHALTITYAPSFLHGLVNACEVSTWHAFRKSLEKKQRFLASPAPVYCRNEMQDIIRSICHCRFQGLTRYLYIESKMMELFVLQMEQLHTHQALHPGEKWRPADKDKLISVKEFIDEHYLDPLTLKEIASTFGLNEFKLKKGYKHFFQATVFGHIHHLRMQKAKQLLQEKEMNVSETAYFIGYNNVSSFSAEFKKRFGYNPSRE